MKKKLIVVLVVVALIFVAACGKTESGNSGGEPESAGGTETESGSENSGNAETGDSEDFYTPESGMRIPGSKTYAENKDKVLLYYGGGEAEEGLMYMEFYLYPASADELDSMSNADFEVADANSVNVLNFFRVLDSKWPKEDLEKWLNWMIGVEPGSLQEYGTETGREEGDYTIYYTFTKEYPDTVPEDKKPIYDGIIADLETAMHSLELFDPITLDDYISGMTIEFESTDLEGNAVNSKDVFSKNKFTMINIWASWCGPCIQELPELEEINKEFEEKGCGIIGLLTDGTDPTGLADAKEIIADTGVTYMNVIDNAEIADMLQVTGVPTTVFVDENGKIVGRTIVGANPEAYKKVMLELLGE